MVSRHRFWIGVIVAVLATAGSGFDFLREESGGALLSWVRASLWFSVFFWSDPSSGDRPPTIKDALPRIGNGAAFLEISFIIVLLGAQVMAELEASSAAGLPWHETSSGQHVSKL